MIARRAQVHWALVLLAAVPGCGNGDGTVGGNGGGNGGSGSTLVLSEQALAGLESVSDDLKTLRFQSSAPQVGALRQGDLIAATVHPPLLPYGALRRVQAVVTEGESVVVSTEFATLAEAVEEGSFRAELPLDEPLTSEGQKIRPRFAGPGQLVFPFDHVVLFDGDKNEGTTDDQITLDGNLSIEPDVVIDIDIENFALQHASVEVQASSTANVVIRAHRQATFDYDETLATIPFTPVVIPLGPIPVVLVPVLEIHAGASGSFSSDLTANLTMEGDAAAGLEYDGSFGPVLEVDPSGSADVPDFLDGSNAAGKVWISAKFKVAVYGLAGAFAELAFYGRAAVDTEACPWWTLYVGVDGNAGAFAEINVDVVVVPFDASIEIFEWQTNPLKVEKLVADAGGCAPSSAPGEIASWARSYGADGIEFPVGLAVTPDGGAVIAGATGSFTSSRDAFLLKVDALGHVAWQLAYDDLDAGIGVIPAEDGHYLLAGENTVSAFLVPPFLPEEFARDAVDPPAYLLRLDANGTPVWARAMASSEAALDAVGIARLADGDVVIAGTIGDPPDGQDVWLARVDQSGALVWSRRIASAGTQEAESLIVDSDNAIVLLASAGADCDFLVKFNADGDALWEACYGSAHNNFPVELVETSDGYTLVGHLSGDGQVNHVDRDGNLLWARHLDSNVHDVVELPDGSIVEVADQTPYDELYAASAYSNGDLLVAGKEGLGDDSNLWAIRLNGAGEAQWIRRFGGALDDEAGGWLEFASGSSTVATTLDGGALVSGFTESFSHAADATDFDLDVWLLKIRGTGEVELDAEGAFASPVGGEVYEVSHFGGPGAVGGGEPLTLIFEPFTPVVYSPTMTAARQGGPE